MEHNLSIKFMKELNKQRDKELKRRIDNEINERGTYVGENGERIERFENEFFQIHLITSLDKEDVQVARYPKEAL